MRAARAVGADQDRSARPAAGQVSGQLRERGFEYGDVVGGGVGAGVSLTQHGRKRLAGAVLAMVEEGQQRMETETLLERRGCVLLVRVRRHESGVDVDDHRVPGARGVVGGMLPGCGPHPRPRSGACRVDRFQGLASVCGEGVDQPRHPSGPRPPGRTRPARRAAPPRRPSSPADREGEGEIGDDLARIMPGQGLAPPSQSLGQAPAQARNPNGVDQRHRPRLRHDLRRCRVDLDTRIQPDILHPEGAPSYADSVTRHLRFSLAWSTFQLINAPSP